MDEPTTALDVVVQREILQEIEALKRDLGFAVLFITHDLSLLIEFADRIGDHVRGRARRDLAGPRARGAAPSIRTRTACSGRSPRSPGRSSGCSGIPGSPPDLAKPPSGCRFHPRCPHCLPGDAALFARQTTERPLLLEVAPGHRVACHLVNR